MPETQIPIIKPKIYEQSEAPEVDPVKKMGKYLTMFAQKKEETGPTTTTEFMQEKELETDEKTGLGNERLLLKSLTKLTKAENEKEKSGLGLLMFDLDEFKSINDTLGHQFGDEVLAIIGKKLSKIVRPTDLGVHQIAKQDNIENESAENEAIRKHGDEFYVITPDLDDTRNGGSKLTKVERHELLAKRVKLELIDAVMNSELGERLRENGLLFGLSIGTAIYQPGQGVDGLLETVDANMYKNKRLKK